MVVKKLITLNKLGQEYDSRIYGFMTFYPRKIDPLGTMLQKLSKCEVKA